MVSMMKVCKAMLEMCLAMALHFGLIGSAPNSRCVGKLRIELASNITVMNECVRLKDIVLNKGELVEFDERLAELVICKAPMNGSVRIITSGQVATKLAQAGAGIREKLIELTGAKAVKIRYACRVLGKDELERAIGEALNADVKLLIPPPPIQVPHGSIRVEAYTSAYANRKRMLLPVRILVDGTPITSLKVLVSIQPKTASSNSVASNGIHDLPISIQPQHTTAQGKEKKAVKRGMQISLTVRCGSIFVRMIGKALNDAEIGSEVKVSVPWSAKPLNATVVDEGEALIELR